MHPTPPAMTPAAMTEGRRQLITACVVLATSLQAIDGTIANVALPYMQASISASQEEINWVLTSYIVAAAVMTAPTGFLAARFGRTRFFVIAITGFTIASALCGLSQSLMQIVICRLLQGAFGAALVPLSQAVLFDIYPLERRGPAMALWSMGSTLGPVVGPMLGGWLTENISWRWVFYINIPVGIFAGLGLLFFLHETPHNQKAKLDWTGFLALSIAIGAFQAMLDRGEMLNWFSSYEIAAEACIAGLGLYIFAVQSALAPKPFLTLSLFTDVNFLIGLVFIFVMGSVMFATLALLAPYLQDMMNYPVITAGIYLAPRGIGTIFGLILCGRLMTRNVNVRLLMAIGLLAGSYALYMTMHWTPDTSPHSIIIAGILQGFSFGFFYVPLATTSFSTLPAHLRTEAAGIFALMRNLGSSIAISVTGALLVANSQVNHAILAARITPFDRILQTGAAQQLLNPATAQGAALLDAAINQQATIIAYNDDFKLLLIVSIAAIPLLLFIRTPDIVTVQTAHAGDAQPEPA